jgi:hypothetical protein
LQTMLPTKLSGVIRGFGPVSGARDMAGCISRFDVLAPNVAHVFNAAERLADFRFMPLGHGRLSTQSGHWVRCYHCLITAPILNPPTGLTVEAHKLMPTSLEGSAR